MALNLFSRPLFSGRIPEKHLESSLGYSDWEDGGFCDYGRDGSDRGRAGESTSIDILDLLPLDPFGMERSTTFAPIADWIEDMEVDYSGYGSNYRGALLPGLNFIWKNALMFHELSENTEAVSKTHIPRNSNGCLKEKQLVDVFCHGYSVLARNGEDALKISNENLSSSQPKANEAQEKIHLDTDEGAPPEALGYAVGYLGVRDLLAVESVCRSLRSTVKGDSLLWRNIFIDQPLNEKVTDDILLKLTNMAQGNLQCLNLVECPKITDDGIRRVLERNPRLTKLCVPGCTRLSIEGIIRCLKELKASTHTQGITHLRIGGVYGVTMKHFEELNFLLWNDCVMREKAHEPHFYHRGNCYLSADDDRAIDIETCPRCRNLRLVYDCPVCDCGEEEHSSRDCRGCALCIARCFQCGRCINDSEYEETFCLELLCSDCSKQIWRVRALLCPVLLGAQKLQV